MKKLMLPLVFLLVGTGGGIGAGLALKPAEDPDTADDDNAVPEAGADLAAAARCGEVDHVAADDHAAPITTEAETQYVEFSQQFVVPVVENDRIAAMMVLTLGVEVPAGTADGVYAAEPRLRDSMLQNMFTHANIGGFSGNFTDAGKMRILRQDLLKSARAVLGDTALDVLVLDLVRQDV